MTSEEGCEMDVSVGATVVLGALVVLRCGLIWFGAGLLLHSARECPACFRPTIKVLRPVVTAMLPNAEWRWCPSCEWQGLARKSEERRWTHRNVGSRL